jgi:hypothetical protein
MEYRDIEDPQFFTKCDICNAEYAEDTTSK